MNIRTAKLLFIPVLGIVLKIGEAIYTDLKRNADKNKTNTERQIEPTNLKFKIPLNSESILRPTIKEAVIQDEKAKENAH